MNLSHRFPLRLSLLATTLLTPVLSAQNVGIGTTTPKSKLSVNGSTASGGLAIGDVGYTSTTGIVAPINGAIIQGSVGIGTSGPDSANSFLTVASTGQSNITLLPAPATSAPAIRSGIFFGDSYLACTDSPSNGKKDLTFFNIATQTNVLSLSPNNSVGVITTTPVVTLDVRSFQTPNLSAGTEANFYWGSGALTPTASVPANSYPVTAYFQDRIVGGSSIISFTGTLTASDSRLKNIIGKSDGAKDLETLGKIEITDYTMKDTVKFGAAPFKKIVAQQVAEVYPVAVKSLGFKGLTYLPDIFTPATKVENGRGEAVITIAKVHGLKAGDSVRLVNDQNTEMEFDVTRVVDPTTFAIRTGNAAKLGGKVFVYGKYCPDMKGVDYEAIAMLNVSATQELARKVAALEEENRDLRGRTEELAALRKENAELKAANTDLATVASDVEALKKAVGLIQSKDGSDAVRAVSLAQAR